MERLLENKVCIITGAAQGIGKSIAERFASDGALVYACDRAEGVMDEWAKACSETVSYTHLTLPTSDLV